MMQEPKSLVEEMDFMCESNCSGEQFVLHEPLYVLQGNK